MQRTVIGEPKTGLVLHIEQSPYVMLLEGRPDPLLLLVVIGAVVSLGVIGTVGSAPGDGVPSVLLFALLFLPLICVLAFNAVRIKTRCVLDKEEGVVLVEEQSYTRRLHERFPIEDARAVVVRRLPAAPLVGNAVTYGLFLGLTSADYLVASGTNEQAVSQDAWRISRFLDLPLEQHETDAAAPIRTRRGVLATAALLYLLPIVVAISVLLFLFDQLPTVEPSLVGLLGAVVISQVGAILAYAYYRARRPYES